MYLALIGDIINSKKISNRNLVQETLRQILQIMNEQYKEDIAANFTITLGDEFQGLLNHGRYGLEILQRIEGRMNAEGVQLRFGIGIGAISTKINPELAIGADGPAYYCARQAIDFLKLQEHRKTKIVTNISLFTECSLGNEELINAQFSLLTIIKQRWTRRQRETVYFALEGNRSQADIAKQFGIAQSNVQRILISANYYSYIHAWETLQQELCKRWEK